MVVTITGTRPAVSAAQLEKAICENLEFRKGELSVHLHHPKDFLLIFGCQALRDHVSGDHFLGGLNFTMSMRPWCKHAHAGSGARDYRVELELRGISAHAWQLSTAEQLLG